MAAACGTSCRSTRMHDIHAFGRYVDASTPVIHRVLRLQHGDAVGVARKRWRMVTEEYAKACAVVNSRRARSERVEPCGERVMLSHARSEMATQA